MIWSTNLDVGEELETALIEKLNSCTDDEKLEWYFSSSGGSLACAINILDIIHMNRRKIVLVGNEFLASSAFWIFYRSSCEKRILPFTVGLMHNASTTFSVSFDHKPSTEHDKIISLNHKKINEELYAFCVILGFTKDQLKKFKQNKDVCFTENEMNTFLNNSLLLNANIFNS